MTKKAKITRVRAEIEDDDQDDDYLEDSLPATMAAILYVMTCPECNGQGVMITNGQRCQCREFGMGVAMDVLTREGLVE